MMKNTDGVFLLLLGLFFLGGCALPQPNIPSQFMNEVNQNPLEKCDMRVAIKEADFGEKHLRVGQGKGGCQSCYFEDLHKAKVEACKLEKADITEKAPKVDYTSATIPTFSAEKEED